MVEKFEDQTQGKDLSQKLLGLVSALGETGMDVAMVPVEGSGNFVFKTYTCPYFEVARNHSQICEMEQDMMADLLGPGVEVKLLSRIVEGGCACEFHVGYAPVEIKKDKVTSVGMPE
jgi:predicted ArsR family transcriptional regulator